MKLDVEKLNIAIAERRLTTSDILKLAKIAPRTWARARKGKKIRPQTAGNIAYALSVPVQSLLTKK